MALTIDASTKVNIGLLITVLGLGGGGIWKMSNVDTRLLGIEEAVRTMAGQMSIYVPRAEYESRVRFEDTRLEHLEKALEALRGVQGK